MDPHKMPCCSSPMVSNGQADVYRTLGILLKTQRICMGWIWTHGYERIPHKRAGGQVKWPGGACTTPTANALGQGIAPNGNAQEKTNMRTN